MALCCSTATSFLSQDLELMAFQYSSPFPPYIRSLLKQRGCVFICFMSRNPTRWRLYISGTLDLHHPPGRVFIELIRGESDQSTSEAILGQISVCPAQHTWLSAASIRCPRRRWKQGYSSASPELCPVPALCWNTIHCLSLVGVVSLFLQALVDCVRIPLS